jgi:preprotein translocase subunit YajC
MPAQQQPNMWMNMIPIAAVFVIFNIFLIRPQQKQMKEHQKMLENLAKGDKILTTGGLYGTIVGIKDQDLEVRFAENVKLTLARSAVAKVVATASQTNAGSPS